MAGKYAQGQSEVLSGVYSRITAAVSSVEAGTRGVVAYPFTANWGPVNVITAVDSQGEFKTTYNADGTSVLSCCKVYKHAYNGKPKRVLGYRMATASAAKGAASLGAISLQLQTKYPTDRAFTATVADGLGGTKVITIYEGTTKLMSVEDATLDGLYTKLNSSDYVTVSTKGTTIPTNAASIAFTGGNNGSVVTATEYSAFLDAMEVDRRANALALDGVSTDAIIETARAWTVSVRQDGFYVTFVTGGPAAWDTDGGTAANTKSAALNNRAIVNVGNGMDGYTGAELAIYIAARVASVALNKTLADEVTPYAAVNKKLKPAQRKTAKNAGTLMFIQDSDYTYIDEGVNTLTVPTGDESKSMGKIRINNALDAILKDLEAFGEEYKKERSNTDEARDTYAAAVEDNYLRPLAAMEVIQTGYFYKADPDYHGDKAVFKPALDEAYFIGDITPVDSMERIYQNIGVNF